MNFILNNYTVFVKKYVEITDICVVAACLSYDYRLAAQGFNEVFAFYSYDGEEYVTKTADSYKKLVVRDNKLVGFILIGDVDRGGIYTSLIRDQVPLDTINFDLIREHPQLMAFARSERAKKLAQPH